MIIYIKNCIISPNAKNITSFEGVNIFVLFIVHYQVFKYYYYFYVFNTILHQIIHNCNLKRIIVRYERAN